MSKSLYDLELVNVVRLRRPAVDLKIKGTFDAECNLVRIDFPDIPSGCDEVKLVLHGLLHAPGYRVHHWARNDGFSSLHTAWYELRDQPEWHCCFWLLTIWSMVQEALNTHDKDTHETAR